MTKSVAPPTDVFADPPRKNVMLLSCMDQRLLDNVVHFMNKLNLQNRYDHVIFAGAAMGAARLFTPLPAKPAPRKPAPRKPSPPLYWRDVFFDHLVTAIEGLQRPIHDIFLLEHVDCGAYRELHPEPNVGRRYKACHNAAGWRPFHTDEAAAFAAEVVKFCRGRSPRKLWKEMQVWSLLMDLRGQVETLGCLLAD
jgi:hypothetical protein